MAVIYAILFEDLSESFTIASRSLNTVVSRPDMTYDVFGGRGTLNLALSIYLSLYQTLLHTAKGAPLMQNGSASLQNIMYLLFNCNIQHFETGICNCRVLA